MCEMFSEKDEWTENMTERRMGNSKYEKYGLKTHTEAKQYMKGSNEKKGRYPGRGFTKRIFLTQKRTSSTHTHTLYTAPGGRLTPPRLGGVIGSSGRIDIAIDGCCLLTNLKQIIGSFQCVLHGRSRPCETGTVGRVIENIRRRSEIVPAFFVQKQNGHGRPCHRFHCPRFDRGRIRFDSSRNVRFRSNADPNHPATGHLVPRQRHRGLLLRYWNRTLGFRRQFRSGSALQRRISSTAPCHRLSRGQTVFRTLPHGRRPQGTFPERRRARHCPCPRGRGVLRIASSNRCRYRPGRLRGWGLHQPGRGILRKNGKRFIIHATATAYHNRPLRCRRTGG